MGFRRQNGELVADGVRLADIAAAVGTPVYVYSWPRIRARYAEMTDALGGVPHRICYAVKANSNLALLARLARLGAGFDVVSGGELERVVRAGGEPARVVFSGVGKTQAEIDAALRHDIGCFNVESEAELARIAASARRLGRPARIAVRVNPDIDAGTHPYIATGLKENKFGVPAATARALFRQAAESPALVVSGVGCHIGSQIADLDPYRQALRSLLDLTDALARDGITLRHIDVGGGFGVRYADENPLCLAGFGRLVTDALAGRELTVVVQPGRVLVADAGVLLTRVEYLKPNPGGRGFAVVDAAMNDMIRPALYQAWHSVEPVAEDTAAPARWDVVGPVCESGDFLALDRALAVSPGALLAVRSAGAYGFTLSSNYNSRCRAAEVLVDGADFHVARRRESTADLLRLESIV